MEEEIDLRQYLEVLIKRWRWIVALTLIAAAAAAAISFLVLQPTYEATALVLITSPRYVLRFDPRLETVSDIETNSKAYPSLATSDDLLQRVIEVLPASAPEDALVLQTLKGKSRARAGADPSLLELTVANGDPQQAAHIANTWAEQYVQYVNELYGQRSEDVTFFSKQLDLAQATLEAAEDALVEFQASNQSSILSAQLSSLRQAQADYLADRRAIARIIQDIQALRTQLAEQPANRSSSLSDNLTALLLQVKAFNAESELPIQLQVTTAESLSSKTVSEQIAFLDDLTDNLEAKSADIDVLLEKLAPETLRLQETVQGINTEYERLTRDRDIAKNTFMALASKVEESRIAAQDETGEVRLASRAAVPQSPVGPRRLMNTVLAGALGLFVGVFLAFFVEFWQSSPESRGTT
jgi:succinoglycan biosynthesis transport protein ExoP